MPYGMNILIQEVKMKKKQSQKLKRIVSGLLSLTMITSLSAVLPANADVASKQEAYPYAVFAADELGGITLNVDGLTVNGNACTNGVYSTTAKYANINGTITENEALVVDEVVTDDESTTDAQDSSNPFDENDTKYIKDPISGGLIDFSHLAATSSAYLFDTSGFKMWAASTFLDYPNYSEDDIDNLAGWAGDLQSMIQTDLLIYYDYTYGDDWIGDHYFSRETLNKYSSDYYETLVFNLLECKKQDDYKPSTHILLDGYRIRNTLFGKSDQLADIDAVNLFVNCYRPDNKTTICDCLNDYYAIKDDSRFCKLRFDVFIGNVFSMDEDFSYQSKEWEYQKSYWDYNITREEYKKALCDLFTDYVYKYTKENTPDGKKWTLYKNAPVTDEVSMGAAKAFSEYIISNWSW